MTAETDFIKSTPANSSNPGSDSLIDPHLSGYLRSTLISPKAGGVSFDDVLGHDKSKEALREMVILPSLRPGQYYDRDFRYFLAFFLKPNDVSNFCKLSVFDFFCETIVKILTLVP
jgi:hypothetical protein